MILSHVGILADVLWHEIKNHSQNVELGEFVVMPNHVHGILVLNNPDRSHQSHDSRQPPNSRRDKACLVSTTTTTNVTIGQQRFQNQGKNTVSSIVGGYKSAVTRHARRLGLDFFWQSRFHDHIIRNEKSYAKIVEYIINNPHNWQDDRFYGGDRI